MDKEIKERGTEASRRARERFLGLTASSHVEISPEDAADVAIKDILREIDEDRDIKFKVSLSA